MLFLRRDLDVFGKMLSGIAGAAVTVCGPPVPLRVTNPKPFHRVEELRSQGGTAEPPAHPIPAAACWTAQRPVCQAGSLWDQELLFLPQDVGGEQRKC